MTRYPCIRQPRGGRALEKVPGTSGGPDTRSYEKGRVSWIGQLDRAATARDHIVRQPCSRRTRLDRAVAAIRERLAERRIEENPGPFRADCDLYLPITAFGPDIEPSAAYKRIACKHRKIEQQLYCILGQLCLANAPAEFDTAFRAEQSFECDLRFVRIDLFAEPAGSSEGEPEELELVCRRPGAVREQLQALLAHFGVGLVGQQLDAIVERSDWRHEIVAKAGAEQARKINWLHRKQLMRQSFMSRKRYNVEARVHDSHIIDKDGGNSDDPRAPGACPCRLAARPCACGSPAHLVA